MHRDVKRCVCEGHAVGLFQHLIVGLGLVQPDQGSLVVGDDFDFVVAVAVSDIC